MVSSAASVLEISLPCTPYASHVMTGLEAMIVSACSAEVVRGSVSARLARRICSIRALFPSEATTT